MKSLGWGTYALMVSVVLWGVLLGGVAYSHMVYFPAYLSDLPASSILANGPYRLDESVFWMSLHPLLILSLLVSLIANWRVAGRRKLIASTLAVYLVIIVVSAIYFIPELVEFKNSLQSPLPVEEWHRRAQTWYRLSVVRGATLFALSIPLLFALVRPVRTDGGR